MNVIGRRAVVHIDDPTGRIVEDQNRLRPLTLDGLLCDWGGLWQFARNNASQALTSRATSVVCPVTEAPPPPPNDTGNFTRA